MSANTVTSFISKLLRPERKDKFKERHDVRKRHSAPPRDFLEILNILANSGSPEIVQDQEDDQKKGKLPTQQKLTKPKNKPNQSLKKSKSVSKLSKSNSGSLSHLLCLSGKVDTLERTPMPDAAFKTSDGDKSEINRNKADFMRNRSKKNVDAKNRFSAPLPGWLPLQLAGELEGMACDQSLNTTPIPPISSEPSSPLSVPDPVPSIRYRVDGTLEKPYVFPGGLTFGPEGRKIKLRRTSPEHNKRSRRIRSAHEHVVHADVHCSSTENIFMEYILEPENADQLDESGFDVRKAFYLRFDSNIVHPDHESLNRNLTPSELLSFGLLNENPAESRSRKPDDSASSITTSQVGETKNERGTSDSKRQSKRKCPKHRYSMPPKNEDFVYMGSFENLTTSLVPTDDNNGSLTKTNARLSRRDKKTNRYSLQHKNSDFVYMGSLEDLSIGETTQALWLTESEDIDSNSNVCIDQTLDRGKPESQKCNGTSCSEKGAEVTATENAGDAHVSDLEKRDCTSTASNCVSSFETETHLRIEIQRRSLPEIIFPNHLSDAKLNMSDEHSNEEEDDYFDDTNFSNGKMKMVNPFSRQFARGSCMPGNKRLTIVPPPCISDVSHNAHVTHHAEKMTGEQSNMLEVRPFNVPPPPCYTPPKETMDSIQRHLSIAACHKGSQADISGDYTGLNMVERDMSLKRSDFKTIIAGISAQSKKKSSSNEFHDKVLPVGNAQKLKEKFERMGSGKKTQEKATNNASDDSQGSDDVFVDNIENVGPIRITTTTSSKSVHLKDALRDYGHHDRSSSKLSTAVRASFETNLRHTSTNVLNGQQSGISTTHHKTSKDTDAKKFENTNAISLTSKSASRSNRIKSPSSSQDDRPVPSPRKRCGAAFLNRSYSDTAEAAENVKSKSVLNIVVPVPRRGRIVTFQGDLNPPDGYREKEWISFPIARPGSDKMSFKEDSSIDNDNTYEEIDVSNVVSGKCDEAVKESEHVYATCEEMQTMLSEMSECASQQQSGNKCSRQDNDNRLPVLREMKLLSSPRPVRRIEGWAKSSVEGQRPYYFGLSSSLEDLTNSMSRFQFRTKSQISDFSDDDDVDSSITDDEMSDSNDENSGQDLKKGSLRRCVSEDTLLRSGNVLDRSLILARKRRLRKCQANSKSENILPRREKESFRPESRKLTKDEKLALDSQHKHKQSHTDSGHDSDMISPLSSPDARRFLDRTTSLDNDRESDQSRHGTLTKKPWEIRLRNKQWSRRCRSRENMSASTSRLETISKTKTETVV